MYRKAGQVIISKGEGQDFYQSTTDPGLYITQIAFQGREGEAFKITYTPYYRNEHWLEVKSDDDPVEKILVFGKTGILQYTNVNSIIEKIENLSAKSNIIVDYIENIRDGQLGDSSDVEDGVENPYWNYYESVMACIHKQIDEKESD